jgi:hypothetical protein
MSPFRVLVVAGLEYSTVPAGAMGSPPARLQADRGRLSPAW